MELTDLNKKLNEELNEDFSAISFITGIMAGILAAWAPALILKFRSWLKDKKYIKYVEDRNTPEQRDLMYKIIGTQPDDEELTELKSNFRKALKAQSKIDVSESFDRLFDYVNSFKN